MSQSACSAIWVAQAFRPAIRAVKNNLAYVRAGFLLITLLSLGTAAPAQRLVPLCDLLRNPTAYSGREVTVRATYRYGFEWQELYCLDCLDMGKAWLEVFSELDPVSERALKKMPEGAGVVNVTVEGTFMSGSTYGHQNAYRYKFVARRISNVAVVLKGMRAPAEERAAEQHWACGGKNPR